jgi:hypothetical protein
VKPANGIICVQSMSTSVIMSARRPDTGHMFFVDWFKHIVHKLNL